MPIDSLPPIERTIAVHRRDTVAALLRNPVRQCGRILRRRWRERIEAARLKLRSPHPADRTAAVPAILRPPRYSYRGFHGPWLEEHFYRNWDGGTPGGASYVPIFFDSLFFHAQYHAFLPSEFASRYRALWRLLNTLGATDRAYFTLLGMYEFPIWEWHLFPRNIVVMAAGGYGDIAIPLLKDDRKFSPQRKDILVSFMGSLEGFSNALQVRSEMKDVFADVARIGQGGDWASVMARSHFSLCPRGQGPTSFRLFEALSVGSIPVYVWRERCWLPYTDELDWSEFALVVEASQLPAAKQQILAMAPAVRDRMQDRIATIYDGYFSYDGVGQRIGRRAAAIATRQEAAALTAHRATPTGA